MMGMVRISDLHSEHQLSREPRSSIQLGSSTNASFLYKIAHCNPLRSEHCFSYSKYHNTEPVVGMYQAYFTNDVWATH